MQISKDYIRTGILREAEKLFLMKGYSNVTMREIARNARISSSNIYNYFENKDAIFQEIVSPALESLDRMLDKLHARNCRNIGQLSQDEFLQKTVSIYMELVIGYRDEVTLLLFKSRGSSFQNFKETFTVKYDALMKEYFSALAISHGDSGMKLSDLSIHLHSVLMFTFFEELIKEGIPTEEIEEVIKEYIRLGIIGWRGLI